jgi:xanthine dehydrogenase iron-sulfur cluster and FAD-binding subunit A
VNTAIILDLKADTIKSAVITLGAVTPIIIHAVEAEKFLARKKLNDKNITHAAKLAMQAARPIDDVRGSAAYRREMVRVTTARGLTAIRDNNEQEGMPKKPILLSGKEKIHTDLQASTEFPASAIETTINGKKYSFASGHDKTLLRLLREEGMLTGTKEGCAEGECGACTVFLDGKADHNRGRTRKRQKTASRTGCIYQRQRSPMRILHAGFPHVRSHVVGRKIRSNAQRDRAGHYWKSLPLYRLLQDRQSH